MTEFQCVLVSMSQSQLVTYSGLDTTHLPHNSLFEATNSYKKQQQTKPKTTTKQWNEISKLPPSVRKVYYRGKMKEWERAR